MALSFAIALFLQAPVAVPPPAQATPAQPDNDHGNWLPRLDYPASALRAGQQGVVAFELGITPDGGVSRCFITRSSGVSALDDETCRVMMAQARFHPARDAQGHPVEGGYRGRIDWKLPQGSQPAAPRDKVFMPAAEKDYTLVRSYIVEPGGENTHCRVERVEGLAFDRDPVGPVSCDGARSGDGYVDDHGKPVRRRVTTTIIRSVETIP